MSRRRVPFFASANIREGHRSAPPRNVNTIDGSNAAIKPSHFVLALVVFKLFPGLWGFDKFWILGQRPATAKRIEKNPAYFFADLGIFSHIIKAPRSPQNAQNAEDQQRQRGSRSTGGVFGVC